MSKLETETQYDLAIEKLDDAIFHLDKARDELDVTTTPGWMAYIQLGDVLSDLIETRRKVDEGDDARKGWV